MRKDERFCERGISEQPVGDVTRGRVIELNNRNVRARR
jgi:hypothetical protein